MDLGLAAWLFPTELMVAIFGLSFLFVLSFLSLSLSLSPFFAFLNGLWTYSVILPVPPEELYATQLSQLQEMGFFDAQENIRALIATAGNVHAAVERLLGSSGQ